MSLGSGRCSVPSGCLVILQLEQPETNILNLLFSGPLGPHQASCLQRPSAAQGPSLRPQKLHLFSLPAAQATPQSWTGRTSWIMITSGQSPFPKPSSALEPVRWPVPLWAGISSSGTQWLIKGWGQEGGKRNGNSSWMKDSGQWPFGLHAGCVCGEAAFHCDIGEMEEVVQDCITKFL